MSHEELITLGFKLVGVEEDDPFYRITFNYPFKFQTTTLSGNITKDGFWLYGNDTTYTDINELEKIINVFK